uniref:LOC785621 protein n=1 Tax=Bos taurus TaxID=9913 RepID=A5PKF4_BOVIN|nr:LOC785621 protein [Bos taurus]
MHSATHSVLLIILIFRGTNGDSVNQTEGPVTVSEGALMTLNCIYQTADSAPFLFWYIQHLNKAPQFLLKGSTSDQKPKSKGFQATLVKRDSSFHLQKQAVQASDSAVYYCALTNSYGQNYFGRGTSLTVIPKVKDPNPTVYQLRSPQSSDTSVCLFTDFDSNQVNMEKIMGSEGSTVHKTNSTVLNMEILGSKSNGIVTWGNTSDAGCEYTFNETIPFASSLEISCNAKLVEKSFETDINLNSQNLSVIVFRILLLKVVGFNLLMTLRLWSS